MNDLEKSRSHIADKTMPLAKVNNATIGQGPPINKSAKAEAHIKEEDNQQNA